MARVRQHFVRGKRGLPVFVALILVLLSSWIDDDPVAFAATALPPPSLRETLPPSGGAAPQKGAGEVRALGALERKLIDEGLVDVQELDPTIRVDLKYACPQNFMGADVYGGLKRCYLRPDAARKLECAQKILKSRRSDLTLLVVDGTRPRSVQRRMWAIVKGTPMQPYVANPHAVSMHNYGAAVDITLENDRGERLDMGSPMDHFGILSQPREEVRLLREGRLTAQHVANRKLLRDVMTKAGFQPLSIEWWHFNACARKTAAGMYSIIE